MVFEKQEDGGQENEKEALHFPVSHFSVGEWKQENIRQEK
jgi:hypothetical protein